MTIHQPFTWPMVRSPALVGETVRVVQAINAALPRETGSWRSARNPAPAGALEPAERRYPHYVRAAGGLDDGGCAAGRRGHRAGGTTLFVNADRQPGGALQHRDRRGTGVRGSHSDGRARTAGRDRARDHSPVRPGPRGSRAASRGRSWWGVAARSCRSTSCTRSTARPCSRSTAAWSPEPCRATSRPSWATGPTPRFTCAGAIDIAGGETRIRRRAAGTGWRSPGPPGQRPTPPLQDNAALSGSVSLVRPPAWPYAGQAEVVAGAADLSVDLATMLGTADFTGAGALGGRCGAGCDVGTGTMWNDGDLQLWDRGAGQHLRADRRRCRRRDGCILRLRPTRAWAACWSATT